MRANDAVEADTDHDEIADRLIGAITRGDVDAVRSLYADSAVIWHNFDRVEQQPEDNLKVLTWLTQKVRGLRYEDIRRTSFDGGFVQQHVLRGTTAGDEPLDVPCCLVVRVAGDRITRIDEYLDTAHLTPLFR